MQENIAPLTKEDIELLWDQLKYKHPFDSTIPVRWDNEEEWRAANRLEKCEGDEYWEWTATHIMIVLAANDALDIPA